MKKGAEAGYGRGFLSGSLFNWRSVINIVGPLVFGTLYAFGRKRNFPGFGEWILLETHSNFEKPF